MVSGNGEPPRKLKKFLEDIRADAAQVEPSTYEQTIESLKDRLDRIEFLVEELGTAKELQDAVSEYVADLKGELKDLKAFRFWISLLSVSIAGGFFAILTFCVVGQPAWFLELAYPFQVSLLITFSVSALVLLVSLLKGVFRSRAERNMDDMLPEHLKVLIEAAREHV